MSAGLVLGVPEDHVAAFLAFDRCEVRVDAARANLRICEGQGDVFAAGRLCLAHPAAADFGRGLTGEDAVVRLGLFSFVRVLFDADGG